MTSTEKQNEYHQADINTVANMLLAESNRRNWGHLVPAVWDSLNAKLTVKLPEINKVDYITTGAFKFPAPEGSESWNASTGATWVNEQLTLVAAAVPNMVIAPVGDYGWDRQTGQYQLPEGTPVTPTENVRTVASVSDAHKADMAAISEALWNQKELQRWCSEFESVVKLMNAKLRCPLPPPSPYVRASVTMQFNINLPWDDTKSRRENEAAGYSFLVDMTHEARKAWIVENIDDMADSMYDYGVRAKEYSV